MRTYRDASEERGTIVIEEGEESNRRQQIYRRVQFGRRRANERRDKEEGKGEEGEKGEGKHQ